MSSLRDLTVHQRLIACLVVQLRDCKKISGRLNIAVGTLKHELSVIYEELDADMTQLAVHTLEEEGVELLRGDEILNHAKLADVLTPRELEMTGLVEIGCRTDEIGRALGMARDTVRHHLSDDIFPKARVKNRLELAIKSCAERLQREQAARDQTLLVPMCTPTPYAIA